LLGLFDKFIVGCTLWAWTCTELAGRHLVGCCWTLLKHFLGPKSQPTCNDEVVEVVGPIFGISLKILTYLKKGTEVVVQT
jgi:hypothetical protein